MKIFGLNISRVKPFSNIKNPIDSFVENGFIEIGANTKFEKLKIEIRSDEVKNYMVFGCDSLLNGHFVIENSSGKILIGDRTFISGGLFISINSIIIGNDVMFSWGCTVMDNDAHSLSWRDRINDVTDWKRGFEQNQIGKFKNWSKVESSPVIIGDKCWIGFNVIILKGVTIGEGAVVAAGSVVTKNVAPYTLVAGNPARYIKDLPR